MHLLLRSIPVRKDHGLRVRLCYISLVMFESLVFTRTAQLNTLTEQSCTILD